MTRNHTKRPWHSDEVAIIRNGAGKAPFDTIYRRLRRLAQERGWSPRTENAIRRFVERINKSTIDPYAMIDFDLTGVFYGPYQISQGLGISPHTVAWWIKDRAYSALLKPQKDGARTLIHVANLKRFLLEYPGVIPPGADIPWVFSVIQYETKPSKAKAQAVGSDPDDSD